jgi:hypothetical protein
MASPDGAVTVAVNVTDWPLADGFTDETTAAVEAALFTTCDRIPDVDAAKVELPP